MISFTKKTRPQDENENAYGADTGYSGYAGYGTDYESGDFSDASTADFTEPTVVDPKPEAEKSTIKLMKFTSAAEREQVADCLKSGYAVIFELDAIDRGDWFRVIDYIQGAIYMIGGTISRFSEYALIAAPTNFDVSKLELNDLGETKESEGASEESGSTDAE
ncbi:MAG: cell division protein SepF [Clostridia bacterium]|nr:cell division protein SepF [Clostridia bacterium]MBR2908678.1 cell division protein SepF [Clostridia bacterium]